MSHCKQISEHLNIHGEISGITAFDDYNIFGGFRARISEIRREFARFGITLLDRKIKNSDGKGYHNEYYLDKDSWIKLRNNISHMTFKKESIIKPKQLEIF